MKMATKLFFYLALASFACLLAGVLLGSLDHQFPSIKSPVSGPGSTEIFIGHTEGLTFTRIGVIGFLASAVVCLALTIIQKIRKPGSSA